jgi:hypothetical protein
MRRQWERIMQGLNAGDILTRASRYNLIRDSRLVYIDVHEQLFGHLAGQFVAVPNLVNVVARQEFQGVGKTEQEALTDCLEKIKERQIEELFPGKKA